MTQPADNPLLEGGSHPAFDRILPEHVEPAMRTLLPELEQALEEIEALDAPDFPGLVAPLERMSERLDRAWDTVLHLLTVRNSEELREAQEALQPEVVRFHMRVAQSQRLHAAFKDLREDAEGWERLDHAGQRIVEGWLRDAELAGVALEGEDKVRFNEIQTELAELSTRFSNHLLDATKAFELVLESKEEIEGLPDSFLAAAAQSARGAGHAGATDREGPWRVTLDIPSFGPFMRHSVRRDLREAVYRAFLTRASSGDLDNGPLVERILTLRQQMAALLGYSDFVAVSLASKMAPDEESVRSLSEDLRKVSRPAAEQEHAELQTFATERGREGELALWDLSFWAERLREERYDVNDEELRPYFPLPKVLEGLFSLTHRLFGVRIEAADGEVPVWHPDVRFFRVLDESGAPRASFYLDSYARSEDKRGGAWCSECTVRSRRLAEPGSEVRLPVTYLVCNQSPPIDGLPSLMTIAEVETLFHEFGHGLHQMLTTVDESLVAGYRGVEWDAVELPSQFMENWIYRPEVMREISGHHETGETLPDDLLARLQAARTFRSGSNILRQLMFGSFDLDLHANFRPEGGAGQVADIKARTVALNTVLPLLPEDRFECGFAHIFAGGYAAGYYGYKWAEVLSADAFGAFEEAGLEDPSAVQRTGQAFRDHILAAGGSRHPMEVFRAFRGREPSTEALLRHAGLVPRG